MSQGVSKVTGRQQSVREPAMSQATREPVMSQGNGKTAMSQEVSNGSELAMNQAHVNQQ